MGLLGCASPDRGHWHGTFDGTVSGVVEFDINTRGTRLRGEMNGQTRDGQPFSAKLEGKLVYGGIDVDFHGTSKTSIGLPLAFSGAMGGELAGGAGEGKWQARLLAGQMPMSGTWAVTQDR